MPLLWTPSHVITDITLTANATNIDVANLDYNNDGPWTLYLETNNPQADDCEIFLFFNADYVLANYQAQYLRASGAAITAGRGASPTIGYQVPGVSLTLSGTIIVDAANYARYRGKLCRKVAASIEILDHGTCTDSTVANITSLRIASSNAGGLGAGTRLILTRIAH